MKRIIPALSVLGILALGSCSNANPGLTVLGAVPLTEDPATGFCTSGSGTTGATYVDSQVIQVLAMKQQYNALSRVMGLSVINTLVANPVNSPSGTPATTSNQADVFVDSADIEVDDTNGSKLVTETVIANSFVAMGSTTTVAVDYLAKPLSDYLLSKSAAFDMVVNVTLHAHTAAGSRIDASPFRLPVHVLYDDPSQVLASSGDGGSAAAVGAGKCF